MTKLQAFTDMKIGGFGGYVVAPWWQFDTKNLQTLLIQCPYNTFGPSESQPKPNSGP